MLRFFRRKSGPPSAADAVSRAFILNAQIVTGMGIAPAETFEQMWSRLSSGDRQQFLEQHRERQTRLVEKLREAGLWSAMSSSERTFVLAPPNQIDSQTLRNASWMMEAEECLLWALGYVDELPLYDAQSDVEHLKRLLSGSTCRGAATGLGSMTIPRSPAR
jgi:predicted Fe-S protein YdhL (DUF1289 family)